jgi:CheY-like chemotaxis protein
MEMIRRRSAADGGETPAIALTARTQRADHERALLAGFQLHLGKPIRASALIAAIVRLLRTTHV